MRVSPLNTEKSLLELISNGDQKAFAIVFNHYSDMIFSFALRITHSHTLAEEIVQDVFLKVWLNRTQLSMVENLGAYLNRITRNHAFNVLKRIAQEVLITDELRKQLTEKVTDTENDIYYHETNRLLNQAIEKLTPQQKIIYNLCHHEGLKYEEVANQLHISSSTVHTHMKNALRFIRSQVTRISVILIYLTLAQKLF